MSQQDVSVQRWLWQGTPLSLSQHTGAATFPLLYTPKRKFVTPQTAAGIGGGRRAASGFSSCLMVFVCLSPQRLPVSPLHAWLWPQESPLSPCHRSKYGEAGTRDVATALGCPHSLSRLTAGNPRVTSFSLPPALICPVLPHPALIPPPLVLRGRGELRNAGGGQIPAFSIHGGQIRLLPGSNWCLAGGLNLQPQCHHSPVPLPR